MCLKYCANIINVQTTSCCSQNWEDINCDEDNDDDDDGNNNDDDDDDDDDDDYHDHVSSVTIKVEKLALPTERTIKYCYSC